MFTLSSWASDLQWLLWEFALPWESVGWQASLFSTWVRVPNATIQQFLKDKAA